MPKARKRQVALDVTPFYHCTSRCVRRAFLCGVDALTGRSYEHRKQWVEDRLLILGQVFAIDICAYAVMSNHLHVVLCVNRPAALSWGDREVCKRWHRLFKGTDLSQRLARGESLADAELSEVRATVDQWRQNLYSISWFMRTLNEPIARRANAEDDCTGKFWEARYTSRALLDETAVLACMVYVDFNPVRANMAPTPESSPHTSIRRRLAFHCRENSAELGLMPFSARFNSHSNFGIPGSFEDYRLLLDWTWQATKDPKNPAQVANFPNELVKMAIEPQAWCLMTTHFSSQFKSFVGSACHLKAAAHKVGLQRCPGISNSLAIYGT